nr:hypothetical protein [Tanacetum cinerariifolium]
KLLEDLQIIKELKCNHPTLSDNNEDHSIQYKENLENSSNSNQEKEGPPQDSDIRQLIREECCIEVCEEQKQNMENFRVIHKSSISLKNTSQISPVHAIAPILSTKDPEYSPSMGYVNPNTTSETELDEIIKSGVEELVPIQSECEVTSEDESKCDMPIQDQSSSVFTTFSNPLFKDNDDLISSDDDSLSEEDVPIEESKVYSNPLFDDDEINSDELESHVESNFVESLSNHDALIDSSQKIDYLEEFSGELAHINPEITESDFDFEEEIHLIENLMYDNSSSQPLEEHNAEEQRIKREPADCISLQDNDSQREEIDIVTNTDDVLPSGVENDDDSKEEIDAVEELHVDNSIFNAENELSDNEESNFDNPPVPRPPPKTPDADLEPDLGDEILVVMNTIVEFDVLNDENDDCFSFMFVI